MIIGGRGPAAPAPRTGKPSLIVRANESTFDAEVIESELPVLVEFGAEWCQPCKQMAPELEALAKELEGKARIVAVDVDESPMLARSLRVQSVPMFYVFAGGRPVDGAVGALPRKQLAQMLEKHLPRPEGAIKAPELAQLIRAGRAVAVDVREAAAYGRARVPGAKNFPAETIGERLGELFMLGAMPILYCRGGAVSEEAAKKLIEAEVPVGYLEGGFLAWEASGLPVER
jgi:thioredoxin 1/putative thioredoxin